MIVPNNEFLQVRQNIKDEDVVGTSAALSMLDSNIHLPAVGVNSVAAVGSVNTKQTQA
jgi:hypothetical protein